MRDGMGNMRTWLILAVSETLGFVAATYLRFGSFVPLGFGGGSSRLLLGGYALVCVVAILAACWMLGDRRPARFAITALVGVGVFSVLGTTVIGIVLYGLAPAIGDSSSMITTLGVWALFCACSLGTASLTLRLAARAWCEAPSVANEGPA